MQLAANIGQSLATVVCEKGHILLKMHSQVEVLVGGAIFDVNLEDISDLMLVHLLHSSES